MKGKLIVIEGTDCSGKETQSKLLYDYLIKHKIKAIRFSFPDYETATGKIIGGPYLGKKEISKSWFPEGSVNVSPKVASLFYAADRLYNIKKIMHYLERGYLVLLDRYITSNMAHQGSKYKKKEERMAMYHFIEKLEYDLLNLPKEDMILFLYVPTAIANQLKNNRENLDGHEIDNNYLKSSEECYLELTKIYGFKKINCIRDGKLKSIVEINKEIVTIITNAFLTKK